MTWHCDMVQKKVLIVYGQGSVVRSGLLARVEKSLTEAGLCFGELGGVKPNPEDGLVREGIAMVRREKYDFSLPLAAAVPLTPPKPLRSACRTTAISGISMPEKPRQKRPCPWEWCSPFRLRGARLLATP